MSAPQCVYVLSDIDGFKYKLVMDGDVQLLTTAKVKRYMHNATGLSPQHQQLSFNGREMQEGECGSDVGLTDGAVLRLRHVNAIHQVSPSSNSKNINTSNKLANRSLSLSTTGFQGGQNIMKPVSSTSLPVSTSIPALSPSHSSSTNNRHDDRNVRGDNVESVPVVARNRGRLTESVCRDLELENSRLRERLLETERQLANACSDWQLQEEVTQLRATVGRLREEQRGAEQAAAAQWRAKEEELVRELDRLREERRRLRREHSFFEEEQRALVRGLEAQLRAQRKELVEQEALLQQQQQQEQEELNKQRVTKYTVAEMVQRSLTQLARELNIDSLKLDDNDTCVVPLDDGLNMLITLDTATERVFMYATIANTLPSCNEQRLQLYELLLEGALLGREMAGGGVGVCTQNNLIIMDICVDVAHADEYALASVARPFMASVKHWVNMVKSSFSQEC
ncbi:uncharacterized protein TM35_000015940 [Trypanosoma theileri]|uniref:Ubiquitin-like domain-containing protein n=1 Tax=Trypanosoma theileri TaxID=67003 RepID=A0A1X0P9V6_9TRYP|nr:uncharacterized protein TM35_000015940 [Trypanosoma theileri]ORC93717.1 hypothetical protein TM35_000015940 [Trypanosoma theileri]